MALTYTTIATVEVGSGGASTIDFTSIPQTYTDLLVLTSTRSTYTGDLYRFGTITFNDSSSSYSTRYIIGENAGASSYTDTSIYFWMNSNSATSSSFGNTSFYITQYASAKNKAVSVDSCSVATSSSGTTYLESLLAGLWSNSSAITKITLTPSVYNFTQYSTATLIGIKNTV